MERQRQNAPIQMVLPIPGSVDTAEDAVAEAILGSPPSTIPTIPFDEDSPPPQLSSEQSPTEEATRAQGSSHSSAIEISDDEEDSHARPRRRNTGRPDYTYREYHDTMDHATATSSNLRKRRREESLTVDLISELVRGC